jgi:radical SAM superfamily enzyme YgiQ (UPF0313 family)
MKITIGYPPLDSEKGIPLLSQNRQFQWLPTFLIAYSIYPVVPASAATSLSQNGHEVSWLDGIAERWSYQKWEEELIKINPDILMIETKTPVIKRHWVIIKRLKIKSKKLKIILVGDHVTAAPEESFVQAPVDYVLTGGDYDFLLLNLVNHLTKKERLEQGIWYKNDREPRMKNGGKNYTNTGKFQLNHDLNSLPLIDRHLTRWWLYAYKNSNFYRAPGAYTMFARDCWWGKCSFCSWTTLCPKSSWRVIKVERALEEIGQLIEEYHVREIMDDSGTFPVGNWLRNFCQGMIRRGYNNKVKINCNMRFDAGLSEKDYQLMGRAGFRFILYGLESASQNTLNRLNKNLRLENVEVVLGWAKKAGLMPHLAIMVGYPWEEEKDLEKTISFTEEIFKKGLANSLQATIVIPYPGTPLFEECERKGLLKSLDWDRYDMHESIMQTPVSNKKLLSTVSQLYSVSIWNRTFLLNSLLQLKSMDGIKYVGLQTFKYLGKLWEFRK